jgi:hypothetical protein
VLLSIISYWPLFKLIVSQIGFIWDRINSKSKLLKLNEPLSSLNIIW